MRRRMLLSQTDNWEYNLVDLGLTSGTLWADRNIGASSPEDYRPFFAWGETQCYTANEVGTKKNFDWNDYKYANGASDKLTKYCNDSSYGNDGFTDNLTELELSDDAAYAYTNGKCKIPTKEQLQELIDETDYTWTTQNGVNGGLFTSKTNGNSIFVPAAGGCYYGSQLYVGEYGYLWSSSLNESNPNDAWYLGFGSGVVSLSNGCRYYGLSVRGVKV